MKKLLLVIFVLLIIVGCKKKEEKIVEEDTYFKVGYSTNLLTDKDKDELTKLFKENNIENADLFFSWLEDYNSEKDLDCNLQNWVKTESIKYNEAACLNRFELNHEQMDGNCRITSYGLLQNLIEANEKDITYGTYLMFDMEVLDTNNKYSNIKDEELKFTTLFNEMDISNTNNASLKDIYPQKWKDNNIKINGNNVSLISLVMHDSDSKLLFVGHTGVLFKLKDRALFIEKIAFEMPYQITVLNSINDLKDLFKTRENYFADGSEEGPFIYENDKLIYEY